MGFDVLRDQGHDSGTLNCEVPTLSRVLVVSLWGRTTSEGTEVALASSASALAQLNLLPYPSEAPYASVSSESASFTPHASCPAPRYCVLVRENRARGTRPQNTAISNSAHRKNVFFFLKKISEAVKSQFEAWNKAFKFLGFRVLFSSSLALDPNSSSFWNLETLLYSNASFLPIISLSMLFFPPAFFHRSTREHQREQQTTYSKPNESPHSGLNL